MNFKALLKNVVLMGKMSEFSSITRKKIGPKEWNRGEIFKFFIVSLLMAHPVCGKITSNNI
jgi:hypothetical protein